MFDYKKLREVIRQGIGESTQAGFARKCGIAPRYLNKLMDADKPARQSKTTLERLASCTETSRENYNQYFLLKMNDSVDNTLENCKIKVQKVLPIDG